MCSHFKLVTLILYLLAVDLLVTSRSFPDRRTLQLYRNSNWYRVNNNRPIIGNKFFSPKFARKKKMLFEEFTGCIRNLITRSVKVHGINFSGKDKLHCCVICQVGGRSGSSSRTDKVFHIFYILLSA